MDSFVCGDWLTYFSSVSEVYSKSQLTVPPFEKLWTLPSIYEILGQLTYYNLDLGEMTKLGTWPMDFWNLNLLVLVNRFSFSSVRGNNPYREK